MENLEGIAALQTIAIARAGQENARLKGEVGALKIVIAHLLHAAGDDTKIEVRTALQALVQQLTDANSKAGAQEVARICQSANLPLPPPRGGA